MGRRIKPYDIEAIEVVDAATDGRAVVKHEGRVVFVEKGVPGDILDVHVYGKKKKAIVGRITKVVKPSEHRTEPRCSHFGVCGGCKWQMMSYESQLVFKQKHVTDAMQRIAKVEIGETIPILGVEDPYFYRNKLEFTFSTKPWLTKEQIGTDKVFDKPALGFHAPGVFDKILNIDTCYLQNQLVNEIRNELRDITLEKKIPYYGIREHTGMLRNVVFRSSEATGEMMVMLIVAKNEPKTIDTLFNPLSEKFPQVTDWIWLVNEKWNSSYSELPYTVWKGKPYITEKLGGFDFRISPTSFFQTNPKQTEKLYGVVKSFMQETLPEGQSTHPVVYDLYSGTGSIGIYVSGLADKIVGIEYVESSIEDAWKNVNLNELTHFNFYAGDMKKILSHDLVKKEGEPDLIIIDPPRAGMDPKVVDQILNILPPHIIYVSCKPATQARDLDKMRDHYDVVKIQPVDMFPHTAHVENVALLKRR